MTILWRRYSLTIILVTQFILSWAVQTYSGWVAHIEAGESGSYLWAWLQATTENWQSEALQVAILVYLSKHYVHVGSPQSRDGDDRVESKIDRIVEKLEA